ncbi:MAG TPA: GDSL-type esterase/lipase family protein [Patescibacteria group bacterium]|nr:GDSL-type esterase/lipase family protein [Patescibacteria group bacterium]
MNDVYRNYRPLIFLVCQFLLWGTLLTLAGTAAAVPATIPVAPPATAITVSTRPALTWTAVENAVFYEVEFLSEPPEVAGGMNASAYQIWRSERIFTAGFCPDLDDLPYNHFFWRVQAYDLDANPLSAYSEAQEIQVDRQRREVVKPLLTTAYSRSAAPLYPVYSWIPVAGAWQYELEILSAPPENPNGSEPSRYRITALVIRGFSYYDSLPRPATGTYYWRVRGLDGIGCPIGVFSDAEKITSLSRSSSSTATFGDSLTHGGGALSHSPAEPEYSYQTYLDFPTLNLGHSGDTTADLLRRFSRDVLPFTPRVLLILGGTNDLRSGASPQSVINNLSILRDLCLARGIRPVFLTIPPLNPASIQRTIQADTTPDWKKNFQLVNEFLRRQRYCIDIAPALTDGQGELPAEFSTDGLHPDIAGKRRMAAVINTIWPQIAK